MIAQSHTGGNWSDQGAQGRFSLMLMPWRRRARRWLRYLPACSSPLLVQVPSARVRWYQCRHRTYWAPYSWPISLITHSTASSLSSFTSLHSSFLWVVQHRGRRRGRAGGFPSTCRKTTRRQETKILPRWTHASLTLCKQTKQTRVSAILPSIRIASIPLRRRRHLTYKIDSDNPVLGVTPRSRGHLEANSLTPSRPAPSSSRVSFTRLYC